MTVKITDSLKVAAVTTIPNGLQNISVLMGEADPGQQLQIFTRDGRQLVGTTVDVDTQKLILPETNGFATNASYSSAYLNVTGAKDSKGAVISSDSYKDIFVFYGAKASMGSVLRSDVTEIDPTKHTTLAKEAVPASLQSERIQTGLTEIAAGQFKLNGVELPRLFVTTGTLQASDIAAQIQAVGIQGIKASAKNEIRIPVSQLKLDLPLSLKSGNAADYTVIKAVPTGLTKVEELITAINNSSSGVQAYLGDDGNLVLTNTPGNEGKDIAIDSSASPNALGLKPATYGGRISISRFWVEGIELDSPIQTGQTSIPTGTIEIDGIPWPGMSAQTGTLQASDIAANIKAAGFSNITASAKNEIRIPVSQLNLSSTLSLKSGNAAVYTVIKAGSTGLTSVEGLIEAINSKSSSTSVKAYKGNDGSLILTNTVGNEGKNISIDGTNSNALGRAGDFGGHISISRALVNGIDVPVELGFANGTPADLAKLGFKTGAYLSGTANEDLLVFVTGAGEAKISAGYSGEPVSSKQALRSQPLQVKFDSATHFTIVDVNTDTVVASRNFDPNLLEPAFTYQGIQISLSTQPKTGDVFTIDGNKDGTGNNENMLKVIDLESQTVMGGGKTFAASYIDSVNDMGNIARQATISQSALKVVYDQAVTARDQVSGVSLDQEAADLVRYQQAYQAAAKILQVASQLFDTVLQVR